SYIVAQYDFDGLHRRRRHMQVFLQKIDITAPDRVDVSGKNRSYFHGVSAGFHVAHRKTPMLFIAKKHCVVLRWLRRSSGRNEVDIDGLNVGTSKPKRCVP